MVIDIPNKEVLFIKVIFDNKLMYFLEPVIEIKIKRSLFNNMKQDISSDSELYIPTKKENCI